MLTERKKARAAGGHDAGGNKGITQSVAKSISRDNPDSAGVFAFCSLWVEFASRFLSAGAGDPQMFADVVAKLGFESRHLPSDEHREVFRFLMFGIGDSLRIDPGDFLPIVHSFGSSDRANMVNYGLKTIHHAQRARLYHNRERFLNLSRPVGEIVAECMEDDGRAKVA